MFFEPLNSVLLAYRLQPMSKTTLEREADPFQPCIVFFSEPEKRISLLLSVSQILPENVFIVWQVSWVKVVTVKEQSKLYLLEGITLNEFGQCFHVKFKTPQKITFLCNFLTEEKFSFSQPVNQQLARQFQNFAKQSNCPMSSGEDLNNYTDDKLHTRLLAVANNIQVPRTLAFSFSLEKYDHHPVSTQVRLIELSRHLSIEEIRTYLKDFPFDKFVIKPSGARWMGGKVCTLESKDNLELAIINFQKCLAVLSKKECLLVEEFIDSSLNNHSALGARLRIFVTRCPNNVVETSGILCQLGDVTKPISGDTSESFSIDYLCNCFQLTTKQKQQLIGQLNRLGETVLKSIINYETQNLTYIPLHQQTDFIGLDVFLKNQHGQLETFLIEVNNHDCISTLQLYEIQHAPHRTGILDRWAATMLYRSYQYLIKDQTLLIVGAAAELQEIDCDHNLGLNLILSGREPQQTDFKSCYQYLGINLDDIQDNLEKALAIVREIRRRKIEVNGIVPFDKKYCAVATLVANFLEKPANNYESICLLQSRLLIQQKILVEELQQLPFEARKFSHGVTNFVINCHQNIENISLDDYPLLIELKPKIPDVVPQVIFTPKQLLVRFEELQAVLPTKKSFGFNCQIEAASYPNGTLQDIVVILSEGKLVAEYLVPSSLGKQNSAQNEATLPPTFLDQERSENLIYAARKVCCYLDLKEGVFYVKGISSDLGAKILDVYIFPWNKDLIKWFFKVWNLDLVLYLSLIACGFKVFAVVLQHDEKLTD